MTSVNMLTTEAARYSTLAEELRQAYGALDDETLADTLEGLSDLPDLLKHIVRSSLDDEVMVDALKDRVFDMKERLDRIDSRQARKRALVISAMSKAGLTRLVAEDFSLCLKQGAPRLEITDEKAISPAFLILQPPRIDKACILSALKQGIAVPGATLQQGLTYVQVRVK